MLQLHETGWLEVVDLKETLIINDSCFFRAITQSTLDNSL